MTLARGYAMARYRVAQVIIIVKLIIIIIIKVILLLCLPLTGGDILLLLLTSVSLPHLSICLSVRHAIVSAL